MRPVNYPPLTAEYMKDNFDRLCKSIGADKSSRPDYYVLLCGVSGLTGEALVKRISEIIREDKLEADIKKARTTWPTTKGDFRC
jgi:hypothetical protein